MSKRHIRRSLFFIGCISFLVFYFFTNKKNPETLFQNLFPTPTTQPKIIRKNASESAQVVRVIDGDTVVISIGETTDTVRLIGVDTPELHDSRPLVKCFAEKAKQHMKELVEGKEVQLESDSTQADRDVYKRLLRYIFLPDRTFVNELLISQGYAHEYTFRIPYQYQASFKEAEKTAKESKFGLWGEVCAL